LDANRTGLLERRGSCRKTRRGPINQPLPRSVSGFVQAVTVCAKPE